MRRRKVVLTIEAETVLTISELRKAMRVNFPGGKFLDLCADLEAECNGSRGSITQVQVNVIKK